MQREQGAAAQLARPVDAGHAESLVGTELPAPHDPTADLRFVRLLDAELDAAVVEKDRDAGVQLATEPGVADRHPVDVAGPTVGMQRVGMQREQGAADQLDRPAAKRAGPDLRSPGIRHQGDVRPELRGSPAHLLAERAQRLVLPMREVQPGHAHAGADQLLDGLDRFAGWSDGGDDLGAAESLHGRGA